MACLQKVVSGKVIKKYIMRSYIEKMTLLERCQVVKNNTEKSTYLDSKRFKCDVQNFLNREDNSCVLPGKGDSVKVGAAKKQIRLLNDYMHNLHIKFVLESDYKISKTSFGRRRPKKNNFTKFYIKRCVSLCQASKHEFQA